MEIHHTKHHQTYINNINAGIEGTEWEDLSAEELVSKANQVPEDLKNNVINNGGGHANHSLFWTVMSPEGGGNPEVKLHKRSIRSLVALKLLKKLLPRQP